MFKMMFDADDGARMARGRGDGAGGGRRGSERGFAAMSPEKQREIARKGGEAVSRNRGRMASIGRKGGEASHGGGGRRSGGG